jgi:hypothetical protein
MEMHAIRSKQASMSSVVMDDQAQSIVLKPEEEKFLGRFVEFRSGGSTM